MSRAYDARRKAKRKAEAAAQGARSEPEASFWRRLTTLTPILVIAAIFTVVGLVGFGLSAVTGKKQVAQEVTELLDGIPQDGAVLGSPRAPVTVWMYGDLECPTVKLLDNWVRTGDVRLQYRSLKTDTYNERIFAEQEVAALAAGRQDRMWNYLLTSIREQGEPRTDYVTEGFLTDIASQVPGLKLARWGRDREDARLSMQVALGAHSGHTNGFSATPSFLIGFTEGEVDRRADRAAVREELRAALGDHVEFLRRESNGDFPTVKAADN
jgi:thioredoxin family protein